MLPVLTLNNQVNLKHMHKVRLDQGGLFGLLSLPTIAIAIYKASVRQVTHGWLDYDIPGNSNVRDLPRALAITPDSDDLLSAKFIGKL